VQRGAGAGCPSPGALFRRTRLWRVFHFLEYGLSIELRSIIRPEGLTLRASAEALFNAVPGNKPYAVYKAILPVYRESRSSGTTGTDIGHGDKHIDAISPLQIQHTGSTSATTRWILY
ncbi:MULTISPECIES: hypothetical protein, partial [Serratia]|uniref:hypothetical protein n=1 Tax=Serratia TaxID=613 RepID=UPI0025AAF1AC